MVAVKHRALGLIVGIDAMVLIGFIDTVGDFISGGDKFSKSGTFRASNEFTF